MTTLLEAQEKARRWALKAAPGSGGEVGLYEFDEGYVAWALPPPVARRGGPPNIVGAPRVVIDRQSGELSIWPSLSIREVAKRYGLERLAEQRFSVQVREVLTAAGWQASRDVSSWVSLWLAKVYEENPGAEQSLPLFPAARDALAEFGGLRFTPSPRIGYADGGLRVELWPNERPVAVDVFAEFGAAIGVPVFPLARYQDGSRDLVVDEGGRVFLLQPAGEILIAATVDQAITELVRQ